MDFDLLLELIAAFRDYSLNKPPGSNGSLDDFSLWLNEQRYGKGQPADSGHTEIIGRNEVEVEIGKLIIYLNRYAHLLIKKGLKEFPEMVNEDFTYIYTLMTCESMTKTQLIEKNVHEKPTGLEVIKRLLKYGLIDQRKDELDKRSKRVFLTEKGKKLFFLTLGNMGKVSRLIAGRLDTVEKNRLFHLLLKLETFHNGIFLRSAAEDIDSLGRYLAAE